MIVGLDEAGCGPAFGSLWAAAVHLPRPLAGLADSKKLTERKRLALRIRLEEADTPHGLGEVTPYLSIGIQLAATMVVYVGIGWLIDRWQDTTPIFLIVGSVVGMVAFFAQLIRVSKELSSKNAASKRKGEEAG